MRRLSRPGSRRPDRRRSRGRDRRTGSIVRIDHGPGRGGNPPRPPNIPLMTNEFEMPVEGITEERLQALVDLFYARVRRDPMIGPVFNRAIHDWAEHLDKLQAFWSSVMLTSGRYKG